MKPVDCLKKGMTSKFCAGVLAHINRFLVQVGQINSQIWEDLAQ